MAARSSRDSPSWRRATSKARCNQASASACGVPDCPQEQDAPQAIDFCFPVASPRIALPGCRPRPAPGGRLLVAQVVQ